MSALESDPLYLAMTRPPLIWGVPLLFVGICGAAVCLAFIWTKFLPVLLAYPFLHGLGLWMFNQDPRFMEILMKSGRYCSACRTKRFFGHNVYLAE